MKNKQLSVKFSISSQLLIVIFVFGIKSIVAGGGGSASSGTGLSSGRGAASVTFQEIRLAALALAAKASGSAGPAGGSEAALGQVNIKPVKLTKQNKLVFQELLSMSQNKPTDALFNYLQLNKQVSEDIIEALIAKGADIRARFEGLDTFLHMAAFYDHPGAVTSLIDHGLYVNVRNVRGFTPLHIAALKGHNKVARVLIAKNAYFEALDKKLRTPLHLAANCDNELVVKTLIHSGADINATNRVALVSLDLVKKDGCLTTLKEALIGREYDEFESPDDYIEKKLVPLDIVEEIGFRDGKKGYTCEDDLCEEKEETPLHLAVKKGSTRLVKLLLAENAAVDGNSYYGVYHFWTPLHCAASIGNENIVKILLKHGADTDVRTICDETPYDLAIAMRHAYIAQLLKEAAMGDDGVRKIDLKGLEIEKKVAQYKAELQSLKRKIQDCVADVLDSIERYIESTQYRSHKKWKDLCFRLHEFNEEFVKIQASLKISEIENRYFDQVKKLEIELNLLDSRLGSESVMPKIMQDLTAPEPWKSRIPLDQHDAFKKSIDEQKQKIRESCSLLLK